MLNLRMWHSVCVEPKTHIVAEHAPEAVVGQRVPATELGALDSDRVPHEVVAMIAIRIEHATRYAGVSEIALIRTVRPRAHATAVNSEVCGSCVGS